MTKRTMSVLTLIVSIWAWVNLNGANAADQATIRSLKEKLVVANRILSLDKLATPFGHVSARIPGTDTFLIARSVAPAMVTLDDILVCDLNGKILEGNYKDTYSEVPIHTEIYKKRKDVNSVAHTHSTYVIALSMTDTAILPYNSFYLGPQPLAMFRKRGLIHTAEWGGEICNLMGPNRAVVLKGHGAVIIGKSIEDVVSKSHILERTAELQWKAMAVGKLVPFTEEESGPPRAEQELKQGGEKGLHGLDREWAYYEYMIKK